MKKMILLVFLGCATRSCFAWGFYAHQKINYYAVFLLPPQMMVLYKQQLSFLSEHAVDPDKRRYLIEAEGPRHYIDIDHYGTAPYDALPRKWDEAVKKYSIDTLNAYGIVPWWIPSMLRRLTVAMREKDAGRILKLSAELGHYIADAHVPLHASSNHNGQLTGQQGIHGFWESRIPELLAEKEWDFFIGKAEYISHPADFIWKRVLESAAAADTVLLCERQLSLRFTPDEKFSFENRNGKLVRQYSTSFTRAYDGLLQGMVERRMRQAVFAVASFWYTAWIDAGQPDLTHMTKAGFSVETEPGFAILNQAWSNQKIIGREHD